MTANRTAGCISYAAKYKVEYAVNQYAVNQYAVNQYATVNQFDLQWRIQTWSEGGLQKSQM